MDADTQIGPYRIVRLIGKGGMGAVYEAVHTGIKRRAALKVLQTGLGARPEFVARLFNEARAVNLIDHPGIVQATDFGHTGDGTAYLVMEFLKGEPLSASLQMPFPALCLSDLLTLMRQLAEILHAAHTCGVVHRDLKPDNIMLVPDPEVAGGRRVKVIDFGIAKLAKELVAQDEHGVRTVDGALMGTPLYMSPEQCQGSAAVGAPSDVYSYGVMFYQLLAGQPPFCTSSIGQLIAEHLYAPPPPLRARYKGVPPALCSLVDSMLAKDPASRPAMAEVAQQLAQLSESRPRISEQPVHAEESIAAPLPKGPVVTTNGLGEHLRLPAPASSSRSRAMLIFIAAAAVVVLFCMLEIFAKARPVVGLQPPGDLSQSGTDSSAAVALSAPADLASAPDLTSSTAAPPTEVDTQTDNKQRHSPAKKKRKDIINAQIPFVQ